MSDAKDTALNEIAALAATHSISAEEIAVRLGQVQARTSERQGSILKQLLGYTGGIFIFSGIGLLFGMIWEDIAPSQRVILTLGTGLAAYVLAWVCHRDERYDRAATPLFLISALLQPAGLFIFLYEYMPSSGAPELAALMVFSVMTAQQGLTFWSLQRTSLLFLSFLFWTAALASAMEWLDFDGRTAAMIVGVSTLCLSRAADKTRHRGIAPVWYFFGGAILLCGFWAWVEGTPLDLAYLGLNGFMVFLSIRVASRTLLFVSVIGLFGYLSYFTYEYFADVTGWPIALIVMGLAMIGLSALAVRLGKRITTS